jgi:hypothetical protein
MPKGFSLLALLVLAAGLCRGAQAPGGAPAAPASSAGAAAHPTGSVAVQENVSYSTGEAAPATGLGTASHWSNQWLTSVTAILVINSCRRQNYQTKPLGL